MTFREELVAEPWRFDLLATLRRLERENADKPRVGDAATLADEYVVVSQNPYLEFPASNLEAAVVEPSGRARLVARFLGMFGPQGALPLTTTEESCWSVTTRFPASSTFSSGASSLCSSGRGRTRNRSRKTTARTKIGTALISVR